MIGFVTFWGSDSGSKLTMAMPIVPVHDRRLMTQAKFTHFNVKG
jgi:hypothetical protein